MIGEIYWDETARLNELFVGRKIIATDTNLETITLDDGTVVEVVPNSGCSCGSGSYDLLNLATCDNVITKVEVDYEDAEDDDGYVDTTYRMFVYADNEKINALTVEGTDGNGWYGSGFWLRIKND